MKEILDVWNVERCLLCHTSVEKNTRYIDREGWAFCPDCEKVRGIPERVMDRMKKDIEESETSGLENLLSKVPKKILLKYLEGHNG